MKINEMSNNAQHQVNKESFSGIKKKNAGYSLSLYVNGQSGQATVRIINNNSTKIVSSTPSQSLHDINDQIYDMAGRLLDKKSNK